jgi:hypothetical protein
LHVLYVLGFCWRRHWASSLAGRKTVYRYTTNATAARTTRVRRMPRVERAEEVALRGIGWTVETGGGKQV